MFFLRHKPPDDVCICIWICIYMYWPPFMFRQLRLKFISRQGYGKFLNQGWFQCRHRRSEDWYWYSQKRMYQFLMHPLFINAPRYLPNLIPSFALKFPHSRCYPQDDWIHFRHYFNRRLLLFSFSRILIWWMAIWLSFTNRSDCDIPCSINTALRFSILERHISSLMEA